MGAYRSQALSLSPWMYFSFDTYTWTAPNPPYSSSIVGEIQAAQIGTLNRRPSMVRTESGDTAAAGFSIVDTGGEMVTRGTDWTYALTVSLETGNSGPPVNQGTPYVSSMGFFYASVGGGVAGQHPWWDLHETVNGTIGIATWGVWSDQPGSVYDSNPPYGLITVYGRYDNDLNGGTTGSDRCYIYDTGIPVNDLMDGRPHLLAVRTLGADQPYRNQAQGPLTTTTSISVSIDGTLRYTSARGPAWGDAAGIGGYAELNSDGTGVDELGIWKRRLSDAEISSLWGTTVWGDLSSWPHLGASTTASAATVSTPDPILRILSEPELTQVQSVTSSPDPVWVEEATLGAATGSAIVARANMGDALSQLDWEGAGTWAGGLTGGPLRRQASKWLDDQDVALLSVPVRGVAAVTGSLGQEADRGSGSSHGRASVSGSLTLAIQLEAVPVHGSSTVFAITIGDLDSLAGRSDGKASVAAALNQGQFEYLAGSSAGGTVVVGDLGVTRYSYVAGEEVGDGEGAPRMGAGGRRRAHFSPKSIGRVDGRIRAQEVGAGIDGSGLGS